jgi:hypothetical protein
MCVCGGGGGGFDAQEAGDEQEVAALIQHWVLAQAHPRLQRGGGGGGGEEGGGRGGVAESQAHNLVRGLREQRVQAKNSGIEAHKDKTRHRVTLMPQRLGTSRTLPDSSSTGFGTGTPPSVCMQRGYGSGGGGGAGAKTVKGLWDVGTAVCKLPGLNVYTSYYVIKGGHRVTLMPNRLGTSRKLPLSSKTGVGARTPSSVWMDRQSCEGKNSGVRSRGVMLTQSPPKKNANGA